MAALEVLALDTSVPQIRAPGAADTYTFPRAVEMPLNTANGVLYLNGSKVATSGSALTFDGNNLGVGSAAGSNARLFAYANDATLPTLMARQDGAAPVQVWQTAGGAESMRFTSAGNLGIGTSSPSYKLHVSGGRTLAITGNESYSLGIGRESNTNAYYLGVHSTTNPNLLFSNNAGATNMTLTYDGNLGLGVTPSAWGNEHSAFQLGFSGAIQSYKAGTTAEFLNVLSNAYNDNVNWRYIRDGAATRYELNEAVHKWFTAPSGTASNTIPFTQAMTLDASGNLMVSPITAPTGMPTAQTGVNVFGGSTVAAATSPGILTLGSNSNSVLTGEVLGRLQFYSNDASAGLVGSVAKIDCLATNNFAGSDAQTALTFHTNTGVAGSLAERMRLDSAGNLGLGITPSGNYTLQAQVNFSTGFKGFSLGGVAGGTSQNGYPVVGYNIRLTNTIDSYQYNTSDWANVIAFKNGQFQFLNAASGTAGNTISFTQAMTLDASGNLGIGTTAPGTKLDVKQSGANWYDGIRVVRSTNDNQRLVLGNTNGASFVASVDAAGGTNNDLLFGNSTNGTTFVERARITSTGNVVAGGSVALATTATDGFLYVPTCAGTPTGTPTAITGMAPIVVNTTNNKLYFYSGGAWRDAGP